MLDPDRIYAALEEAGDSWAHKKADFEEKDDLTKTVLADLTSDYLGTCKSMAEAETRARGSAGFKNHLAEVSAARRTWLLAQVKFENLKTLAELRRSQESSERAKMNLR